MLLFLTALLSLLIPILPDQPTTVTLTGAYVPVDIPYSGTTGEILTITARSLADEPIDVTLELLLNNQRVAFNDDESVDEQDAVINSVVLPTDGTYTIRVNSFNGAQTGDVEITVAAQNPLPACETQTINLQANRRFGCQLEGQTQAFRITARDLSGTLDPRLSIYAENELVAGNDDHAEDDATLNTLDAQLEFTAQAVTYTVYVSDFSGAAGEVELTVEIVS